MADAPATPALRSTGRSVLSRCQAWWPRSRRRRESGVCALAESDIRRLDDRIDALLEVLVQAYDYSGQPEVAADFRALSGAVAQPQPLLRLVHWQQ
jgi:hypothetical protein